MPCGTNAFGYERRRRVFVRGGETVPFFAEEFAALLIQKGERALFFFAKEKSEKRVVFQTRFCALAI